MDGTAIRIQLTERLAEKEIILFGAGNYARQFYRDFHERLNIKYCISNDKKEKVLCVDGKETVPVVRVDSAAITDGQFIILCAERYWEMEIQLRDMGYRNGVHYIRSGLARALFSEKKIALFYGVCYMRALYRCMTMAKKFSEKYESFYWLDYRRMEPEEYELFSFLLPLCDLFIYNVCISYEKQKRSQAYLSRLPMYCKKVRVPLISFSGYHPRTEGETGEGNPYDVTSIKTYYGTFMVPDYHINRLIRQGKPYREVVKIIGDVDFYSRSWLEENFNKGMKKLKLAERLSDVKVVDFLLDNHGKERLFLNETHIANPVTIELAGRILDFIGLDPTLPQGYLRKERLLFTTEIPIYPSVIKHLELKIYENHPKYRLFTFGEEIDVSFEEYVERYYEYCVSMKKWMEKGYFPK